MGSYFYSNAEVSDNHNRLTSELNALKEKLEQHVSKEELESYVTSLIHNTNNINSINNIKEYELNKEITMWKDKYEELQEKYDNVLYNHILPRSFSSEVVISDAALKEYVISKILETDANLSLIPDSFERKIYINTYRTLLQTIGSFNAELANHKLSIVIQPKKNFK